MPKLLHLPAVLRMLPRLSPALFPPPACRPQSEIEKRKEEAERQAMERERELEEQRLAAEQLAREAEERRKEQER